MNIRYRTIYFKILLKCKLFILDLKCFFNGWKLIKMFFLFISFFSWLDICHQVLDLYSMPIPKSPQASPPATPPTKSTRKTSQPVSKVLFYIFRSSSFVLLDCFLIFSFQVEWRIFYIKKADLSAILTFRGFS